MNNILLILPFVTLVGISVPGCKEAPTKADATTTANTAVTLNAEVSAQLNTVLAAYEELRDALAGDRLSDVSTIATRIEQTTIKAKQNAPSDIKSHLEKMETTAVKLKTGGSADDLRLLFGDLSRSVVSVLSTHSTLARGRHIFQCPMAQGYQKWVQTSEKLENPYMGGKMLSCGSTSEWSL